MSAALRAHLARYAVALAASGVALLLALTLQPLSDTSPALVLLGAVVVSAGLGGLGPALLTTALGGALLDYFFEVPRYTFEIAGISTVINLLLFVLVALVVSSLHQRLRDAMARAAAGHAQAEMERQRVTDILESLTDGFVAIDTQWRYTYVNHRAEEMLRRSRDELLGQSVWDMFPPAPDSPFTVHARRAMTERTTAEYDTYSAPLEAWLSVRLYPSTGGLAIYFQDVTARKQTEEALRLSEERLRIALQHTPIIMYTQDRELRYTWLYNAMAEYSLDGALGKSDAELAIPEEAAILTRLKQEVMERGEGVRAEVEATIEVGRRIYDLVIEPLHDAAGSVVGVTGAAIDITARKRAEAEREGLLAREQAARQEAEQANRTKDELVTLITHDLKNPLTSIQGWVQILRRRAVEEPSSPPAPAAINAIEAQATRMDRLLDQMLDTARLQAGEELPLRRGRVDLTTLVDRLVEQQRATVQVHELAVHAPPPGSVVGLWDNDRLEQVVGNLLSNALRYSPQGGRITVTLAREDDDARRWATLQVADEGLGIPCEDLPRVFERFHRGANVVGRISGMGIGLAGARQIVEQHGGTITVASEEGRGSTFTVRLPL